MNFDGFNPLRWKYYKHVGMRVELHGTGRVGKWRIQRALDVTFPLDFDFFSEARRAFMNNILANLTTVKGFKANHRLTEYYKRLHFANQYRLALAKSCKSNQDSSIYVSSSLTIFYLLVLINDKRRNRIKTLDQYYHLRANMVVEDDLDGSFTSDVTWQIAGRDPSAATFKKAVAIALIIPLIFCWGFLVACVFHSLFDGMAHLPPSAGLDLPPEIVVDTPRPAPLNGGPSVETDEVIDLDALSDSLVLEDVLPRLKSIHEYSTGITFQPHLNGLYLVGAGVRNKSIVKVYAVAMYSSPTVLLSASSAPSLGMAARTFSDSNHATTFRLEMVYSVSAEKIASAIAESVRPRYQGSPSDIRELESLIIKGVNEFGGQASKGTTFQFECTSQGVLITVNDSLQGGATFEGLGSAFVDVFMDEGAVSPTLVDSCLKTWSSEEAQSLAASLLAFEVPNESDASSEGAQDNAFDDQARQSFDLESLENQLEPIQEYATSITFETKLDDLYLVGAGVRKKSIIKVYAVAMYASAQVLVSSSSQDALHAAARSFDGPNSVTTFALEMVYGVGAEKIAGAIAESVKPRYSGPESDVSNLEQLITEGVNRVGGQAVKGTVFRFDCTSLGVAVSVNELSQGSATFEGLGAAFVDVFMDNDAVSPTLVESCISMWSGVSSNALAVDLFQASSRLATESDVPSALSVEEDHSAPSEENLESVKPEEELTGVLESIESELEPIREYYTGVIFNAKLDGLYLVGAGVRKKSIVKVYAVAMYASPSVLASSTSSTELGTASLSLDDSEIAFVLEMVYSVGAEKIASAIAESVHPRFQGPSSDIKSLESLIIEGVNSIGGQAVKGTVFKFVCATEGVTFAANGAIVGSVVATGLASAFVDVFVDSNAVSPSLVDNCVNTWSSAEARKLATDLRTVATSYESPDDFDGGEHREGGSLVPDPFSAHSDKEQRKGHSNGPSHVEPRLLQSDAVDDGETTEKDSPTFAPDLISQLYQSPTTTWGADSARFDDGPGHDYTGMDMRQIATRRAENFAHRKRIMISSEVISIRRQLVIQSDALDRTARNLAIWGDNEEEMETTESLLKILFPVF